MPTKNRKVKGQGQPSCTYRCHSDLEMSHRGVPNFQAELCAAQASASEESASTVEEMISVKRWLVFNAGEEIVLIQIEVVMNKTIALRIVLTEAIQIVCPKKA